MQSLTWYVRRLRSMSAPEATWRLAGAIRDRVDRYAAPVRRRPLPSSRIGNGRLVPLGNIAPVLCHGLMPPGGEAPELFSAWRSNLIERANGVLAHRVRLFGDADTDLGPTIDWNRDYSSGTTTPGIFSPAIDYRDFRQTGDAKWVWELNRHHHLVLLGRAYRLTSDSRYAAAAVSQLCDWIDQCPFGFGMNWRSPLELAIRLINWVCTFELIAPSGAWDAGIEERIFGVVYRHLWEISRKWSRFSSANNHLVGEAAGVFIGSTFFSTLRGARDWQSESREILVRQIDEQTFEDGGHRELAIGYHLFVAQFFLLAGLAARHSGKDFPAPYWNRLEKMFEFAAALIGGGESLPMFGDCDDGYVLDLGGPRGDARSWLAVAGAVFQRDDFLTVSRGPQEPLFWLLGAESTRQSKKIDSPTTAPVIHSRAFPNSGLYLLQDGGLDTDQRLSVTFDCGELGFKSIAAHGHADALSVTLRVGGQDILIDPGTYDYFTYPAWRDYFRSTRAHNTIQIDGRDQSEMLGPFLWGQRARARCLEFSFDGDVHHVIGEHDGYSQLEDPVTHRRRVALDRVNRVVTIEDELISTARHDLAIHFHFSEACSLTARQAHRFRVDAGRQCLEIELDPRLSPSIVLGSETPMLGWASRAYHRKSPSPVLLGREEFSGGVVIRTRIRVLSPQT